MADFNETACDYLSCDKHATFCSNETKWINKIRKLEKQYPNDVEIQVQPEDNQGMLLAHIPKSWFKISPPRKVNYTDEQRAAMAERMKNARSKQEC